MAVVIAGGGGAAIAAATGGGQYLIDGGLRASGGPPSAGGSQRRADAEPDALHGEYVVADGHGEFTTLLSQTGRVTAISPASVTARSDDGFVQTYVIREADGAAKPQFLVGDEIAITATRKGETATISTMRPPLSG